jgi:hypothetical protein
MEKKFIEGDITPFDGTVFCSTLFKVISNVTNHRAVIYRKVPGFFISVPVFGHG